MAIFGKLIRIENCFIVPAERRREFNAGVDAAFVCLLACFALFFHPDEALRTYASAGYFFTCLATAIFFNTRFQAGKTRDFPPRTADRRSSAQWLAIMAMTVAAPFV
jgi:hypothetical protein